MSRRSVIALVLLPLFAFVTGCGTGDDVTEAPPPPPTPKIAQREDTTRVVLQSRTDTIAVRAPAAVPPARTDDRTPKIRFMVQIGAFKDPHLATAVQTSARQRFHMPVLNDYNIQVGLYQIRLGFFETRSSANAFRRKMAEEYPADYKDSWVVQLTR